MLYGTDVLVDFSIAGQLTIAENPFMMSLPSKYGLYKALWEGDEEEVERLLKRGWNIKVEITHYGNALQAASFRSNKEVVKLLLQKGAYVNARGGQYDTALQAASYEGHEEVIQLLLSNGADVNAQGGQYGNALQMASYRGHRKLVELLLEEGAYVNARGGQYGTALQAASYDGHEEVVRLLLSYGANVNAQGGQYGNALQMASYRGDKKMVELLLEEGADVNAQGGKYGNALQAASYDGHEEVIRLLLTYGANVNAQGGQHGNALRAASFRGHKKVMTLLLSMGADVNVRGMHATSLPKEPKKATRIQLDEEADAIAPSQRHSSVSQSPSHEGREKAVLQVAAEDNLVSHYTGQVPLPEMTEDDSCDSGYDTMGEGDATFQSSVSTAAVDDSSRSGYEIISDEDEDIEVDDSIRPNHNSPLASLRDRISNPVEYFDRLTALAHLVYQHSTLQTYSKSYSPRLVAGDKYGFEPFPRYPDSLKELTPNVFEPLPDNDVIQICEDVGITLTCSAFASDLLEILECRNVIAQTYSNLQRLQLDGFCLQKFSILTIDPCRHDVVRLLPIDTQVTLQLLKEVESVLQRITEFARRAPRSISEAKVLLEQALEEQYNILQFVPCCSEFLSALGLILASPGNTRVNLSISAIMRLVVNTTDLAVASYAGAHISRFDEEYLGEEISVIDVLGPFASLHKSPTPSIKLSRCHLQCLDSFHSFKPVWVFSQSEWEPCGQLFLSTKVEDFADIWGPLWKVVDPEVRNSCTRYAVGNGYIYKWKPQEATPGLLENETLCHWISDTAIEACSDYSSNTEKLVFPDIIDESFNGNETLLIGAVAAGCERLVSNKDCKFDLDRARSALDHDGKVQMLGTVREHNYTDSMTYQLQAGYSGMNVSASKQYKRRGQSLKQALVELWTTTPELRDPRLLQDFYGLEVSLCTQNAQRTQLGRILGLGSMCRYLKTFRWKTDSAKQAYFDALKCFTEDNDALRVTWERHNQYQEDFGRAVLICLKALEKTGINHKGQLSTFLSSEATARPELIVLEPKKHTWIGLLKDDEINCTMAVIGDECLEFKHKLGSICGWYVHFKAIHLLF